MGVIRADEAYRLSEACRRLGFGEHSLRRARRAGLKTRRFGRSKFVLGADIIRFLESLDDDGLNPDTDGGEQ